LLLALQIAHFGCKFNSSNPDAHVIANFCRWNPERQNVRYSTELKGHSAGIEKVAFNPVKDAELCSVSSDGVVKFWDVRTKAVINEIKGLGDAFTLAWCPDGESLVVGNKVWFFFTT
jgi:WD40 repeat protein